MLERLGPYRELGVDPATSLLIAHELMERGQHDRGLWEVDVDHRLQELLASAEGALTRGPIVIEGIGIPDVGEVEKPAGELEQPKRVAARELSDLCDQVGLGATTTAADVRDRAALRCDPPALPMSPLLRHAEDSRTRSQ